MTKNDKVSSWGKNDKKWLKMTQKGSKICSKIDEIHYYQLFNLLNAQKWRNMTLSHFEEKWQNDWKWHKMTLKMIENDINEWNWL